MFFRGPHLPINQVSVSETAQQTAKLPFGAAPDCARFPHSGNIHLKCEGGTNTSDWADKTPG